MPDNAVRLSVGADGKVAQCAVIASSGAPALDTKACEILTAHIQIPAGSPKTVDQRIRWCVTE